MFDKPLCMNNGTADLTIDRDGDGMDCCRLRDFTLQPCPPPDGAVMAVRPCRRRSFPDGAAVRSAEEVKEWFRL